MTPVIYLENSSTVNPIQYDSHGSFLILQSSNPLAYSRGVYEILIKVKIKVPSGYFVIVENFSENLLNGNTILKYDTEKHSIIMKVENNFVVPKFHPLCKLRLLNTIAFEIHQSQ